MPAVVTTGGVATSTFLISKSWYLSYQLLRTIQPNKGKHMETQEQKLVRTMYEYAIGVFESENPSPKDINCANDTAELLFCYELNEKKASMLDESFSLLKTFEKIDQL